MGGRFSFRHVLVLLAVVLAGWGVGQLVRRAVPVGDDRSGDPVVAAVLRDRASPRQEAAGTGAGADLTMVVFTDYRCPACRASAGAMEAAVRGDGRVTVVYKDWPIFGGASITASTIAIAAAPQGIYPALHRLLMAERRGLTPAVLDELVRRAGGDPAQLAAGGAPAQLAANARQARALGLPGTPAYLIGPVLVVGALDEAGFRRGFARARELAAAEPDRPIPRSSGR